MAKIMIVEFNGRTVELTDEQIRAYEALTPLQKKVSLNILSGMKPAEAHRAADGKCRNEANRHKLASEILTKPDVTAFLDSFNVQAVSSAVMSREEMLERLTIMARTKITDIMDVHNHPVVDMENGMQVMSSAWALKDPDNMTNGGEIAISELTAGKDGLKIKLHDQRAAMKQLAELQGFDSPSKIEHSGEVGTRLTLSDFYGTDA